MVAVFNEGEMEIMVLNFSMNNYYSSFESVSQASRLEYEVRRFLHLEYTLEAIPPSLHIVAMMHI